MSKTLCAVNLYENVANEKSPAIQTGTVFRK